MTVLQRLAKKNLVVQHPRRPRTPLRPDARPRRAGRRPDGRRTRPGRRLRRAGRPRWCTSSSGSAPTRPTRCGARWPNSKPRTEVRDLTDSAGGARAPTEGDCQRVRAGLHPRRAAPGRTRCRRCWRGRPGRCAHRGPRSCCGSRSPWPPCCRRSAPASRSPAGCSCPAPTAVRPPPSPARSRCSAGRCGSAYVSVFALTLLIGARLVGAVRAGGRRHPAPPGAPPDGGRPGRRHAGTRD